jgi:hypothetical protein
MAKGRFLNQKLGKNVSRKVDLLKSQLAGRNKHMAVSHLPSPPTPKKETFSGKI